MTFWTFVGPIYLHYLYVDRRYEGAQRDAELNCLNDHYAPRVRDKTLEVRQGVGLVKTFELWNLGSLFTQ